MASFALDVPSPHPPDRAWAQLWDLRAHTALIPFTTVRGTAGPGARFVARTALGRWGFDDPMDVLEWDPPRHARIVKRGRVVRGTIDVVVEPDAAGGSRVRWAQEIAVAGVPSAADPVSALIAKAAYRSVLRRLVS